MKGKKIVFALLMAMVMVVTSQIPVYATPENQNTVLKVKQVVAGGYCSGAITEDGSLYMWGSNSWGQLGKNASLTPIKILDHVKSVSLGTYCSGAILEDGSLYMWGSNEFGSMGDESITESATLVKVLENVQSISLGMLHSGAITEDGSLYMWGKNSYGELGNGTTTDSLTPIKVLDHVKSVSLGTNCSGASQRMEVCICGGKMNMVSWETEQLQKVLHQSKYWKMYKA